MYKKILLAVDGSENSLRATDEAVKIAKAGTNSEVEVLYVKVPPKTTREILLEMTQEEQEKLMETKMAPIVDKINNAGVKFTQKVLRGEAPTVIVNHSHEIDCDLIVIGSRGLNAVQKFVLGGVSNEVVKKSTVPVLLVK